MKGIIVCLEQTWNPHLCHSGTCSPSIRLAKLPDEISLPTPTCEYGFSTEEVGVPHEGHVHTQALNRLI